MVGDLRFTAHPTRAQSDIRRTEDRRPDAQQLLTGTQKQTSVHLHESDALRDTSTPPFSRANTQAELIRFARVGSRETIIDVYPGNGDWTRIFSNVVGAKGSVSSFVPAEAAHFTNDPIGLMRTLAAEPGHENVQAASADVVALADVTPPADVVRLHLFYHDLHTAPIQAKGATADAVNRAVYQRLKPNSRYVIIDHAAAAGTGTGDAQSLRRIDPASVRREVEAAGFVLEAETPLLANMDAPHSIKVLDPSVEAHTYRFAYRFFKP